MENDGARSSARNGERTQHLSVTRPGSPSRAHNTGMGSRRIASLSGESMEVIGLIHSAEIRRERSAAVENGNLGFARFQKIDDKSPCSRVRLCLVFERHGATAIATVKDHSRHHTGQCLSEAFNRASAFGTFPAGGLYRVARHVKERSESSGWGGR
jgi:hypothetical protein